MADDKAECVSCLLTVSKLKKSLESLKAELKEKNELILEFTSIATTQAKHLSALTASGYGYRNTASLPLCSGQAAPELILDPTIPWSGSTIAGVLEADTDSVLPEEPWLRMGAKQKTSSGSKVCLEPAETQVMSGKAAVEAPVSSTPRQPELWSLASRHKHRAKPPSPLSTPPAIKLTNKFDVLSLQDFPPLAERAPDKEAVKSSSARRRLLKEAVMRRSSGGSTHPEATVHSAAGKEAVPAPERSPEAPARPPAAGKLLSAEVNAAVPPLTSAGLTHSTCDNQAPGSPPVCIIGSSIVRGVAVSKAKTFCFPGACVKDLTSSAIHLLQKHPSTDTIVVDTGFNDVKFQQSETLKADITALIDEVLETGKQCVISGPLPPPCFGDVKFSRVRQLHVWLKGYCRSRGIPFVDNFTTFLNRSEIFKRDGLHPNHRGTLLLSRNIELTLLSCKGSSSSP